MKIIQQKQHNECGICCTNMLINFYAKTNLDIKAEILENCSLNEAGLSILDLEELCLKYKIILDTYKCNWNELIKHNSNNPIVLVMNKNNSFHFVIAFVKNQKIIIYDPCKTESYSVANYLELNNWTGYVSFTKSNKFSFKPIYLELPLFKNLDIKIVLTFMFVNILEFAFTILISWFLSKIINIDFNEIALSSIFRLSFVFLILIVVNSLFNFINNYIKDVYFQKQFIFTNKHFFNKLLKKNYFFYKCYNKQQILQIWNFNNELLNFYCHYWSELLVQIIIFIASFIFVLLINKILFIGIVWLILIKCLFYFITYNIDINWQNKIIKNQTIIEQKFYNLLEHKEHNLCLYYESNEINNIIDDFKKMLTAKMETNYKNDLITSINTAFDYLFNFVLIIALWRTRSFNIGVLYLIFNLLSHFKSANDSLLKTIKSFLQIKPIYKLVLKFYSTNNITDSLGISLLNPSTIKWNNNYLHKNLLINIDNLLNSQLIQSLLHHKNTLNNININNVALNNYDSNDLHEKIIFINSNFSLTKEVYRLLIKKLNKQKMGLDFTEKINNEFTQLNKEWQIILVLEFLSKTKNSIICFNNFFITETNENYANLIKEKLMTISENDNYIISNTSCSSLLDFYDCHI